jgi:hypothetical protein
MLNSTENDFPSPCVAKLFKLPIERNMEDSEGHSAGTQQELLKLSDIKPQMYSLRNCLTVSKNMMGCWKSANRQTQTDRHKLTKLALSCSSEYYSQTRGMCTRFISSSSVKKWTDYNQAQEHTFAVPVTLKYITVNTDTARHSVIHINTYLLNILK